MQQSNAMQQEVAEAVRVLRAGGVILYPTDTVWGLGCDATNAEAVAKIYRLKQSDNKKSMLVLCASADMVVRYVDRAPGIAFEVMELDTKGIDAVWNGMTLTQDVKTLMETSEPYCKNAQVVVISEDRAANYQTEDSIS